MKFFIFCLTYMFFALNVFGASILWDQAFIDEVDPDYHGLCHFAYDENGNGFAWFGVGINYDYASDYYTGEIHGVFITPDSGGGLAYAMNIDEMQVGDTVSEETIRGDHNYFYSNWIDAEPGYDGSSPETSWIYIPTGGEIYLGFLVEDWPDCCYYGWLSLIFDGTEVRVGQSAVETTGGPIAIQPRQIPEPSAAALIALGVAMLLVGRSRGIMRSSRQWTTSALNTPWTSLTARIIPKSKLTGGTNETSDARSLFLLSRHV